MLVSARIVHAIASGSGVFKHSQTHGQTYVAHPLACAAALALQTTRLANFDPCKR